MPGLLAAGGGIQQGAQKGRPSPQGTAPTHEMPTAQSGTGGLQASTAAADSEGQLRSHLDLSHQVSETLAAHMPIDSGSQICGVLS